MERSPADLREVGNYVVALEYGIRRLKKLPLSLRLVRKLHEKLMTGVRGEHATPGEFRRSQNWIGPPLLYLSAFFEATRRDYYDRLQGVRERGAWADWLQYFLNGVARQSEDALGRAERINGHLAQWRVAVSGTPSKVPLALVDQLAANPFLTVKGAAKRLGVAFTTAQRAVAKLEELSIITEISRAKRDRIYCARPLLGILEEPARLTSMEV